MSSPESHGPAIFQTFKTKDKKPPPTISTQVCTDTGKRYVLWSSIQEKFVGINYLQDWNDVIVLFMINYDGQLYLPLRIEHNPDESYKVVKLGHQSLPTFESILEMCAHLYDRLEFAFETGRSTYQQVAANARHHHVLLRKARAAEKLENAMAVTQDDGMSRKQILEKLGQREKRVPDWDHRNVCYNMLYRAQNKWEYATSKLFIVLPSSANSWDDLDPSTHHFRLHFLCDNRKSEGTQNMPQHVHLANHAGYNLLEPQDFFKKYGNYVLRVLHMIKKGCNILLYEIPPMDPFKILWKCEPAVIGSHITTGTITDLVDKAISYLEEHSPPEWTMEPGLTRNQSAGIKDFLDVQPGHDTEGSLHRHIDSEQRVTWRCKMHQLQYFNHKPLTDLTTFVQDHEGDINMQQTTVRAVLRSSEVADQFRTLLKNTQQSFNHTLELHWKAKRSELHDLCVDVAGTKAAVLDVDGVTLDSHPQGYIDYTLNLFADKVAPESGLQLITLVNYPRSQAQCLHFGRFSLQTTVSPTRLAHNWVELKTDLDKFGKMVSLAAKASDCHRATEKLKVTLNKHGYSANTLVTIHESVWSMVFIPEKGGVVEVYSHGAECPKGAYSCESLRELTVHMNNLELDEGFFQLVQTAASLQELNVSYCGHNVMYYIDSIVKMWRDASSPFRLTLIDRMEDTQGRVVAQMNIRPRNSDQNRSEGSAQEVDRTDSTSSSAQVDEPEAPAEVQVSKWDCDRISAKPSDSAASILDTATEQHPEVLKSLTLDTSELSPEGVACISKVLGRSDLDHLNMACNPFDPKLPSPVAEVLDSIRLNALKSLVLSGSDIDGWVKLWPLHGTGAPQLIHLGIRGSGPNKQDLSHDSVLAIHDMIYPSPLVDLKFEHVGLQNRKDWALIAGALDPKLLKTMGLCKRSKAQFESCPEAMDILKNNFPGKKSPLAPNTEVPVLEGGVEEKPGDEVPDVKDEVKEKLSDEVPAVEDRATEKPSVEVPVVEDSVPETSSPTAPALEDAVAENSSAKAPVVDDAETAKPSTRVPDTEDSGIEKPSSMVPDVEDPISTSPDMEGAGKEENPNDEVQDMEDVMVEKPSDGVSDVEDSISTSPVVEGAGAEKPTDEAPVVENAMAMKPSDVVPAEEDEVTAEPSPTDRTEENAAVEEPSYVGPTVEDEVTAEPSPTVPAEENAAMEESSDVLPAVEDGVIAGPSPTDPTEESAVTEKPSAVVPAVEEKVPPKLSFWRRMCCCCYDRQKK
ncbi:hypothetical protein BG005_008445 [Podila minutissima]|nr:hypothetical protein BG005_008445 [Podila minutissima]